MGLRTKYSCTFLVLSFTVLSLTSCKTKSNDSDLNAVATTKISAAAVQAAIDGLKSASKSHLQSVFFGSAVDKLKDSPVELDGVRIEKPQTLFSYLWLGIDSTKKKELANPDIWADGTDAPLESLVNSDFRYNLHFLEHLISSYQQTGSAALLLKETATNEFGAADEQKTLNLGPNRNYGSLQRTQKQPSKPRADCINKCKAQVNRFTDSAINTWTLAQDTERAKGCKKIGKAADCAISAFKTVMNAAAALKAFDEMNRSIDYDEL